MGMSTIAEMVEREKIALKLLKRKQGVTRPELMAAAEITGGQASFLLARLEMQGYARHTGSARWAVYADSATASEAAYASRADERSAACKAQYKALGERIPGTYDRKPVKAEKAPRKGKAKKAKRKPKAAPVDVPATE